MHFHKQKIICFGIGLNQLNLIKESKNRKNFNIIVENDKKKIFKNKFLIDKLINISSYDLKKFEKKINKIDKKNYPKDIIYRSSGPSIINAYKACKKFKIKKINKSLANIIYSKSKLNNFLKKNKIKSSETVKLKDLPKIKKKIYYVIKPDAPLIGKKGVFKISNFDTKILKKVRFLSHNKKIFISKYINGSNISVFFFIERTNKKIHILNFISEINSFSKKGVLINKGICGKTRLKNSNLQYTLELLGKKIIRKFKNYYGFFSISFLINKKNIFPYEINVGIAGDKYAELIFPYFFKNNIFELEVLNLNKENKSIELKERNNNFIGIIKNKKFFSQRNFNNKLKISNSSIHF